MVKIMAPALMLVALFATPMAAAEVTEIKIAGGFGLTNLPLMVMDKLQLLDKQAHSHGIEVKGNFVTLAGGANMNDAMLAGAIDLAFPSPTSFLPLWARTRGTANEVKAIGAIASMPLVLTTRNPSVKTIGDFTAKDKIAVPSLSVSIQPILLRMAAAKELGQASSTKLDPLTVAMPHPEAAQALLSGAGEIDAHFTSPPYYQLELKKPGIHVVLNSYDLLGGPSTFVIGMAPSKFVNANPKAYASFLAALSEAIAFINANKREAARIYLDASKDKAPIDDILAMLNDPQIVFTTVPQKTMVYADFMFKEGMIKVKPESWKDLFFPNAQTSPGS